jgi:hypothetical protein
MRMSLPSPIQHSSPHFRRATVQTNVTRGSHYAIKSWPDRVNLLLGLFLCVSPWLAMDSGTASTWNAVFFGSAIIVAALFAIAKPGVRPEWSNVVFGLWLLVAPWALGFSSVDSSMYASVLVGIFVTYFACMQIILLKRPAATRRPFRAG